MPTMEQLLAEIQSLKNDVQNVNKSLGPVVSVHTQQYSKQDLLQKDTVTYGAGNVLSPDQYFQSEAGLFNDACLEAPIMNLTVQPQRSIMTIIPAEPTVFTNMRVGFISQIDNAAAGPQDVPCSPAPKVGEVDACFAEFGMGRLSYATRTQEIDHIIERACRGVRDDLYVVGNVRGVQALSIPADQMRDRDFITGGAVMRQIMMLTRDYMRTLGRWTWIGDPDDPTQNGAGGGWRSFPGLDMYINDQYGEVGAPIPTTGANCALLNSDVKDFGGACVGAANAPSIYEYLSNIEEHAYEQALHTGVTIDSAAIVMHPRMWREIAKVLPCQMAGYGCGVTGATLNLNNGSRGADGMFQYATYQEIVQSQRIVLNGRSVPVFLDDFIPYTLATVNNRPNYTSTIYYIPFVVSGQRVLYWKYKDFTQFGSKLAPIPNAFEKLQGWVEGGRFYLTVQRDFMCFAIESKTELGLVFTAPHLAGRIDNVTVCPLQEHAVAFPSTPVVPPPVG